MQATRSMSVRFCPLVTPPDPECSALAQWSYSRRVDRAGPARLSACVSVVTRPGLPGYWVCRPQYCYTGGPRRYRRLPPRIERTLWLLHWRTTAVETARAAAKAVQWAVRGWGDALRRHYDAWQCRRMYGALLDESARMANTNKSREVKK
ncbi:hypothetical protein ROR02_24230 [Pararhodospirillum oryzae]|uniref:Uncharacterized protein n=1 Tax=Pararhodospirillum oryzae TaxID=478448 RepID=A0A512HA38_9PROT|nr:hypothetical protein ROR02_24230 [Pararhodospirillum oryzae]